MSKWAIEREWGSRMKYANDDLFIYYMATDFARVIVFCVFFVKLHRMNKRDVCYVDVYQEKSAYVNSADDKVFVSDNKHGLYCVLVYCGYVTLWIDYGQTQLAFNEYIALWRCHKTRRFCDALSLNRIQQRKKNYKRKQYSLTDSFCLFANETKWI